MDAAELVSAGETGGVYECALRLPVPAAIVFAGFTDPQLLVRWMGRNAELAPRPGGIFRLDYGDGDVAHGAYLEIAPFSRVVFTWGWEGSADLPPGTSTVIITLEPAADGTLVRLVHEGLTGEQEASHADGWNHYLGRLVTAATHGAAAHSSAPASPSPAAVTSRPR